jgi:serine/threonine protein kinase/tetratricopeptide (TPR) repeat protein
MPRCPSCHRRLSPGKRCPHDGAVAAPNRWESTPAHHAPVLAGFSVGAELGAGGFAVVFAAVRQSDGAQVALKIARDQDILSEARLQREADVLRAVGPEHTPLVYETGRTMDGRLYIAMERLTGRSLAAALEQHAGPPAASWVLQVSSALIEVLHAVHECGMVHRDLKPENVFLISELPLALKLFDFGLTVPIQQRPDERLTRPGTILGTSEYMAPEQLGDEREPDHRLDIYAFGVMLYELFALRPPFVGDRASIEHGHRALRPPSPREFALVPESLEEVILWCLAKAPEQRPANIETLRQALVAAWKRAATDDTSIRESKLSLLVEKRHPVVLAAIETDAARFDVHGLVKRYGGFVAKETAGRYVSVFSGLMVDDPFESALGAGHDAHVRLGARVALHLAHLAIRRKRRGPVAVGRAIDQPSDWLPSQPHNGVVLSRDLVDTRPEGSARPAPDCDGFYHPVALSDVVYAGAAYIGRDELMQAADRSLRACLHDRTPGLFTVLGDAGLGKSRLAHELAHMAQAICPEALVVSTRARRLGGDGSHDENVRIVDEFQALHVTPDSHDHDTRGRARTAYAPRVVIIDDGHWCARELLDHIEYATLDHPGVPLWIAVLAHPNLETIRAQWGARADRHDRFELLPLPLDAAMKLAAELLLPADYPPADILERLAEWAGGSPQVLSSLVAELKRRGMVRKSERGEGWQVATAELSQLPGAPDEQWLYSRMLDQMPPDLAACVRVCAVLGPTFTLDELSVVQNDLEQRGGAGTRMDAGVGLDDLVNQGLFERSGRRRFAFVRPAFQDSVYKLLAKKDRQQIHEYAAAYWQPRVHADRAEEHALECFARHAGACGRGQDAAAAYLQLGDSARKAHLYVQADNYYTAALRLHIENRALEARLLGGRGSVRHSVFRLQESFDDLRAARAIFEQLGDQIGAIEQILEEATAADIAADYEASARCAEEAWRRVQTLDDPVLATRCQMALGRTHWRFSRIQEAIQVLGQAAERAREHGDIETEILAQLLFAPALAHAGQIEASATVFEQLIDLCARSNDRFHECAAYVNRMFLWLKQPEHAIDDLRRAVELGRQVGNPEPEYIATHNLAELLFWLGQEDEALMLAQRCRVLQLRFMQGFPLDAILLARIHLARGEVAEARELFRWLQDECKPDRSDASVDVMLDLLSLLLYDRFEGQPGDPSDLSARWDSLMQRGQRGLLKEQMIEVCWWQARQAIQQGNRSRAWQMCEQARAMLIDAPVWQNRIDYLSAELS